MTDRRMSGSSGRRGTTDALPGLPSLHHSSRNLVVSPPWSPNNSSSHNNHHHDEYGSDSDDSSSDSSSSSSSSSDSEEEHFFKSIVSVLLYGEDDHDIKKKQKANMRAAARNTRTAARNRETVSMHQDQATPLSPRQSPLQRARGILRGPYESQSSPGLMMMADHESSPKTASLLRNMPCHPRPSASDQLHQSCRGDKSNNNRRREMLLQTKKSSGSLSTKSVSFRTQLVEVHSVTDLSSCHSKESLYYSPFELHQMQEDTLQAETASKRQAQEAFIQKRQAERQARKQERNARLQARRAAREKQVGQLGGSSSMGSSRRRHSTTTTTSTTMNDDSSSVNSATMAKDTSSSSIRSSSRRQVMKYKKDKEKQQESEEDDVFPDFYQSTRSLPYGSSSEARSPTSVRSTIRNCGYGSLSALDTSGSWSDCDIGGGDHSDRAQRCDMDGSMTVRDLSGRHGDTSRTTKRETTAKEVKKNGSIAQPTVQPWHVSMSALDFSGLWKQKAETADNDTKYKSTKSLNGNEKTKRAQGESKKSAWVPPPFFGAA